MSLENFKNVTYAKIIAGFALQAWQTSGDKFGNCLYNGPNNLHCAVGLLLDQSKVNANLEISSVTTLINKKMLQKDVQVVLDNLSDADKREARFFLSSLQTTHDMVARAHALHAPHRMNLKREILRVARERGVDVSKLETEK